MAAEGNAIARHGEMVIFVKYAAPGDIVDIRITKTRKRHMEGEIVFFHKKSAVRAEPFCEHFGICGGCRWQHLNYDEQLRYKQQQVIDSIARIGKVNYPYELLPPSGSEKTQFYRNKLEYTFATRRWLLPSEKNSPPSPDQSALGFHIPGFFDKILDIKKCWLQPEPSNAIRLAVRDYALKNDIPFFDFKENKGMLRNIIIRNNIRGEVMVIVVFYEVESQKRDDLLEFIKKTFSQVVSLYYMINNKKNTSLTDLEPRLFAGEHWLMEEMEGLKFKVGAKSFYQTNSGQAHHLYKTALLFAQLTGNEIVYDLYTGTGTIANFVARRAQKVVGIEYVEEAIDYARENSDLNNLHNLIFVAGDMAKVFTEDFMNQHGQPDVIITDPPRAGMHPDVLERIALSGAKRVVYVSCNPASQARDIELLSERYKVVKVQAVDMFPHTHHVESVVLLEAR